MKKFKIEIKWALIFTVMSLAWVLLEKTLGWHDEQIANHWYLTLFFFPFAFLMYYLAVKETRRRVYNYEMSWKQGFLSGCMLAVFTTLLSPLAEYITHNYITPEYFETVKNYSVTNELMKIEEANDYFNISKYIWQSAIGLLIVGVITAAIVALVLKRK